MRNEAVVSTAGMGVTFLPTMHDAGCGSPSWSLSGALIVSDDLRQGFSNPWVRRGCGVMKVGIVALLTFYACTAGERSKWVEFT